ncbi:DUF2071 domain-containing protein [Pedosphaera parvula]|uniref:DUF2071 domain-containing protein n=1 Tax=Pedosphaera parvula (strain Ellin514) TaxID=320771 RepID=B9XGN6_PEDPL|nr:DUF2071 domain-containing protein [Pedosphaera parvula]EEF61087.1 conserved hypothetical protein [Pedosphaera parvula Ellin514]
MKATLNREEGRGPQGEDARQRLLSRRGEPLFYSDWLRPLFIHYEVDPEVLQREVPFPLDLRDGKAYVSVVAFTMARLRPVFGGKIAELAFLPIASHGLLNVRTYVQHEGERGIYFLSEWIPNRLSVALGPRTFGLPFLSGKLSYLHHHESGMVQGEVTSNKNCFAYAATFDSEVKFDLCAPGSLDEFLVERYTAFTCVKGKKRFFRIWHPPWSQKRVNVSVLEEGLLMNKWSWFKGASLVGANYSEGAKAVWMGRPHRIH